MARSHAIREGGKLHRPAKRRRLNNDHTQTQEGPHSFPKIKTHSRNERKNNPSSRIYSIRKQLTRDDLPPNIKIEKERELASLIFDQQRDKQRKERSQMISRYHTVRFFERRKAERNLKKLTKERDTLVAVCGNGERQGASGSGDKGQARPEEDRGIRLKHLNDQIREATVDLNYCLYSPLMEKYISIFHSDKHTRNKSSESSPLDERDQPLLSEEKREDLISQEPHFPSILEFHERSSLPPTWFEVEEILYPRDELGSKTVPIANLDDQAIKQKLEMLRNRTPTTYQQPPSEDVPLTKSKRRERHGNGSTESKKNAKRAQSTTSLGLGEYRRKRASKHAEDPDIRNGENWKGVRRYSESSRSMQPNDDESEGDGGFFER